VHELVHNFLLLHPAQEFENDIPKTGTLVLFSTEMLAFCQPELVQL